MRQVSAGSWEGHLRSINGFAGDINGFAGPSEGVEALFTRTCVLACSIFTASHPMSHLHLEALWKQPAVRLSLFTGRTAAHSSSDSLVFSCYGLLDQSP